MHPVLSAESGFAAAGRLANHGPNIADVSPSPHWASVAAVSPANDPSIRRQSDFLQQKSAQPCRRLVCRSPLTSKTDGHCRSSREEDDAYKRQNFSSGITRV